MRIGQKVTVVFSSKALAFPHWRPPAKFLRCYVIRRVSNGWQLYDPVRDYSWGLNENQTGHRVVVA